jgi:hypothetical protein
MQQEPHVGYPLAPKATLLDAATSRASINKGETSTLQIKKVIRLWQIGPVFNTIKKNRDGPEHESLLRYVASLRINVAPAMAAIAPPTGALLMPRDRVQPTPSRRCPASAQASVRRVDVSLPLPTSRAQSLVPGKAVGN